MYGVDRLIRDLIKIGYQAELVAVNGLNFVTINKFEIELGIFKGRDICLGIQATNDFPRTTASSIHVKTCPQLLEKKDSIAKVRNIIDSPLGPEWRYWSHNFNWKDEKSTRRLMNQIKGIFANV